MARNNRVDEHIERCLELYGSPLDTEFAEPITRASYEQMRADLMVLLGITAALAILLIDDAEPRK